uniref:hypothetical protein n=1 Tax=Serratia marcescens TaxID=615 RepID=UPI002238DEB4|nr:hypothetical protein [Serratia marcescens]
MGQAVVEAHRRLGRQRFPTQAVGQDHRQRRAALALAEQLPRQIDAGKCQMVERAEYVVLQGLRALNKIFAVAGIAHRHEAGGVAQGAVGGGERHRHPDAQLAIGGPVGQRIEDQRRQQAVAQQRMRRSQAAKLFYRIAR